MKRKIKSAIKRLLDGLMADHPAWRARLLKLSRYIAAKAEPPRAKPKPAAKQEPAPAKPTGEKKPAEHDLSFSRQSVQALCDLLEPYDLISFDVFDTLIFRAFDQPRAIFSMWALENGEPLADRARRDISRGLRAVSGGQEITLEQIYRQMETRLSVPCAQGMEQEIGLELRYCMPNPYMQDVYRRLLEKGKRIILMSDMYLPRQVVGQMLEKCGYSGYEALYVSSEYGITKGSGALYAYVESLYPDAKRRIQVGDSVNGDVNRARAAGWDAYHYQNVNGVNQGIWKGQMSELTGGLYRGLVNAYLYNGEARADVMYDLGYAYFGLPVIGFCQWIRDLAADKGIGLILFAARDMYPVYALFCQLYDTPCQYVPISRAAVFRTGLGGAMEFLLQRLEENTGRKEPWTIGAYLKNQNLPLLIQPLCEHGVAPETPLTEQTLPFIKQAMLACRAGLFAALEPERRAADAYFRGVWEAHGQPERVLFVELNGRSTSLTGVSRILRGGYL